MTEQPGSLYAFTRDQWLGLLVGLILTGLGAFLVEGGAVKTFTVGFGAILSLLAVIDARWFILPDWLNGALALCGLGMVWMITPQTAIHHFFGGLVGYRALVAVELYFRYARGIDGLGRGDAKLLGAIGLWVSWTGLPLTLVIASLGGLIFGLVLALRGQDMKTTPIPFGPFLALGGWCVWLFQAFGVLN